MKYTFLFFAFLYALNLKAQTNMDTELPYRTIPENPKEYTACTVAARAIDGLGFRYYWATDGLRTEDLSYKPNEEARNTEATIDHIYGLALMIHNTMLKKEHLRDEAYTALSFAEKRANTLKMLKEASDILKKSQPKDMEEFKIRFATSEVPFWNLMNGPIEDAVWHVGQVVSFRRSSGNPFNPKVNVFMGTVKE